MNVKYLVIHCSATKENQEFDISDIDRWHKALGWRKVGYHFVVKLDGIVQNGRSLNEIGSHVKGHNRHSIGICYIGGLDKNGNPKDTRTPQQKQSILDTLYMLREKYPKAIIQGHRDFAGVAKACPCFNAKSEYKELPKKKL